MNFAKVASNNLLEEQKYALDQVLSQDI